MNANSMRLIRRKPETRDSRQEAALREIVAEHIENKWTPIDPGNGQLLPIDEILSRSFLNAIQPQRIPLSRRLLRVIEKAKSLIW
jgi:hypothetical protein